MNIVLLDAATLGDDLNIKEIEKFGKLTVYQTTSPQESMERISDAEIVITNKVIIDAQEMDKAKKLKLICIAATGMNNINLEAAKERNIEVKNVQGYSTEAVAQHTLSLILALQNSLLQYAAETRSGNWSLSPIFTMLNHPFYELKGKKLGIIGYGSIGKRVAELAKAFGMEILIAKRKGIEYKDDFRVDFETILQESDVISIHTPLSEQTRNMFTGNEFAKMKKSAIIINTARGGIINEKDLFDALKSKTIRAAAIDVTEKEPIPANSPLPELDNLIITPHIAWTSIESRQKLLKGILKNIEDFLNKNK